MKQPAWKSDPDGDRAVRFINNLTHIGDFTGQPFDLRPWQEAYIRQLFGSKNADGRRRYRNSFIFLPRKQGKTELLAAILLYLLLGEGKQGQEIYSAAADREQASRIFYAASQMVRADPYLSKLCDISDYNRRITVPKTGNLYCALASDGRRKHGLSPSAILADELHCWRDRELWDSLTSGFGARREPLTLAISTAGNGRQGICWDEYEYATKVRDGIIDNPSYLPLIYEAKPTDDWRAERVWRKTMPALGDFCDTTFIRNEFQLAKDLPSKEMAFKRLYLNLWQAGQTRWLDVAKWDLCQGDLGDLDGKECYAAIDLSSTTDFTCLVLVFREENTYKVMPFFWLPEANLDQLERRDKEPYRQWERHGYLLTTDGDSVDYDAIRSKLRELGQRYRVKQVAADPWNATHICQQLRDLDGFDVVMMRQGFLSMNAPAKELERLIAKKQIVQGGNPVMRAMVNAVAVKTDESDNIRPVKPKGGSVRIDGVVATIMAIGLAMTQDQASSIYDLGGVLPVDLSW